MIRQYLRLLLALQLCAAAGDPNVILITDLPLCCMHVCFDPLLRTRRSSSVSDSVRTLPLALVIEESHAYIQLLHLTWNYQLRLLFLY